MKTKFKSILAVTLAATTFFSCSNEIEAPDNAQMLNPGDVQISIGLGNGTTTYSTVAAEKAFKNGSGKLFVKDGAEIPMKNPAITMEGGALKFTAIVEAGKFTEGSDASLYLYVNGTPDAAAGADEAAFKKATVSTVLDRDLTNGLPAGFGPSSVTLKGGIIATGSAKLNRAASRVGAKFTGSFAANYKVALKDVNLTSGALFEKPAAADAAGTVERTLDGLNLGTMYNQSETVAYVYPSSKKSAVVVTPPVGMGAPKTINFAPTAGKNYMINITPATGSDASLDWTVTIAEWDITDENIDADFGVVKVAIPNGATGITGFTGVDGKLSIDLETASADVMDHTKGVEIAASKLFSADIITEEKVGFTVKDFVTRAVKDELATWISTDGKLAITDAVSDGNKFSINALPNNGADLTYTIKVQGLTSMKYYTFDIVVKGLGMPDNFSTTFNGFEVMTLPLVGAKGTTKAVSLENTKKALLDINKLSGKTFAEKVKNYVTNGATCLALQGYQQLTPEFWECPKGYRYLSSTAELMKLFATTGTWVRANDTALNLGTPNALKNSSVKVIMSEPFEGNTNRIYTFSDKDGNELTCVGVTNFPTRVGNVFVDRAVLYGTNFQQDTQPNYNNVRCVRISNFSY